MNKESKDIKVSASMMCADWLNLSQDLQFLNSNVDFLHLDIIDGSFAPDFTMGTSIVNKIKEASNLPCDFHFMVEEPARLLATFKFSKLDVVTIHQECCRNLHRDLVNVRRMGTRVGVAICPGTPLEVLDYIIEDVDVVLLMMVNPGFMGMEIVPQTLRKIGDLKNYILKRNLQTKIEVDGSVNSKYITQMVQEGADILVGGSSGLFRKDIGLKMGLENMKKNIELAFENPSKKLSGS